MTTAVAWEDLTERQQLMSEYSDYYKEAHGFRPRHSTAHWTVQDFRDEFERLGEMCQANEVVRKEDEAAAIVLFDQRVVDTIALGAKDRATAIRWIADAEQSADDMEFLCYQLGLPYGHFYN